MSCPLCNRTDRLNPRELGVHLIENHVQPVGHCESPEQQIAAWDGVSSKLDACVQEAEMPTPKADDPPNRYFDGMEATIQAEKSGRETLVIDRYWIAQSQPNETLHAIMVELARRWNAEPGLRDDNLEMDDNLTQHAAVVKHLAGRVVELEKISEARRRALEKCLESMGLLDSVRQQVDNAIAGVIDK